MQLTAIDQQPVRFLETKLQLPELKTNAPCQGYSQLDAPMKVQWGVYIIPGKIVPVYVYRKKRDNIIICLIQL